MIECDENAVIHRKWTERASLPPWRQAQLVLFQLIVLGALILSTVACQDAAVASQPSSPSATPPPIKSNSEASVPSRAISAGTVQVPATITPNPTSTRPPGPTSTPEPSPTATATPIGTCADRMPVNGLTALVTMDYGIAREYEPPSLVELDNYLPITVTLGYPTQIREIAANPLTEMIRDMHAAGLRPTVISGYRSYASQTIARTKWQEEHPERVSIISAPPGHSEHQLGTTVDFGSPELATLVGDDDVEFHTNFYMTSEGQWLAQHAHEYGFILSYPRETFELTGMYYEPWHYRYVGRELAEMLKQQDISLISYLLATEPPPCIP